MSWLTAATSGYSVDSTAAGDHLQPDPGGRQAVQYLIGVRPAELGFCRVLEHSVRCTAACDSLTLELSSSWYDNPERGHPTSVADKTAHNVRQLSRGLYRPLCGLYRTSLLAAPSKSEGYKLIPWTLPRISISKSNRLFK